MTNTIYDITHESDAILLVGSNPEHAHPVIGMQVRQAVQRGAKLIVVDPRDIDLCKDADIHLKLKPGRPQIHRRPYRELRSYERNGQRLYT